MDIVKMLRQTVKRYADKAFIIYGERRMTYLELEETSNKIANALIDLGIKKGDRVSIVLPNMLEYSALYFGIVKSGAIAVPLDYRYKADELVSLYNNSQPRIMISSSPYLETLASSMPRFTTIEKVIDMSGKFPGQYLSYAEIMARFPSTAPQVELNAEDLAHVAYTSGTTGQPKGVMVMHRGLVAESEASADGFKQTDKDVVMLYALPMHHCFAMVVVTMTSIYKGSTIVMSPGLSISAAFDLVAKEKGTIFMGVPSAYVLAVELAEKSSEKYDLSSLRLCGSAGATLPLNIMEKFRKYYGLGIINFWGQTEAMAHVTIQPIDGSGKYGAVGKPLKYWEVKIVDDSGNEMPVNQAGEMIIRGPFMKGYFNNPTATAATLKNGWLYSGDIGRMDEDGYFYIMGRKKELIIVAGQKVYPIDVESVLYTYPKIAEAAVVGVPDGLRGEAVRAVVRLKDGQTCTDREVRTFCREHMADFKVPKEVFFINLMPKTASGKIKKQGLEGDLSAFTGNT